MISPGMAEVSYHNNMTESLVGPASLCVVRSLFYFQVHVIQIKLW